jgi:hypothetical protein
MEIELWKPCVKTGKLIRAYLDVALRANKGSDSISHSKKLTRKVKKRLSSCKNPWGTNEELSAAIKTLRKGGGLPSIKKIKKTICAVQRGKYDVS